MSTFDLNKVDIRSRVYFFIRTQDVELAEQVYFRMPEINDVVELNTYFHGLLARYAESTVDIRRGLKDNLTVEQWLNAFGRDVLPFMIQARYPEITN